MHIKAFQFERILGVDGNWVNVSGINVFADLSGKIILPSDLKGQNVNELDTSLLQNRNVNSEKVQLVAALMASNIKGYKRLQTYLTNLANIIALGSEFKAEREQFDKLMAFLASYNPIDAKMRDFLRQYEQDNAEILQNLKTLIDSNNLNEPSNNSLGVVKKTKINPINVKQFGIYRFPFLQKEKLYLGEVENNKIIPQDWNATGGHFKLWVSIKGLPFLINGYKDDEYSVVNRLLAAQAAKRLGLPCEEVFFGYFHGKCVTLTTFHEAVTLLENQVLELYELDGGHYIYQSNQKRAFYFLIQHWTAYANVRGEMKERFDAHFVEPSGGVFLSNHQQAMFLAPWQMANNLLVKLEINNNNYRAIKDVVLRVGQQDLADIVFSSIPDELIELHDAIALKLNKTSFQQKKEAFDANWTALLESIQEFEQFPRTMQPSAPIQNMMQTAANINSVLKTADIPGFVLAFFQKNPKTKPQIKAILSIESDGRVWAQTTMGKRPYKSASLVTPDGHVLLADSDQFLRELSNQAKMSQITYEYTKNVDRVAEYLELLSTPSL